MAATLGFNHGTLYNSCYIGFHGFNMPFFGNASLAAAERRRINRHNRSTGVDTAGVWTVGKIVGKK